MTVTSLPTSPITPLRFSGKGPTPPNPAITNHRPSVSALPNVLKPSWLVKQFDYQKLATTTRRQSQAIYSFMVLSRLVAAAIRGKEIGNYREVFEHATRDIVGWSMFFFGASTLVRLFAKGVAPNTWHQVMTSPDKAWVNRPFMGNNIADKQSLGARFIRGGRRLWHTMFKSDLLSDTQIEALQKKRLAAYQQAGTTPRSLLDKLFTGKKAKYSNMVKLRNGLSTMGLIVNIALMGIAIPLLNILITKNQVADTKAQNTTVPVGLANISQGLRGDSPTYGSDYANLAAPLPNQTVFTNFNGLA